MRALGANPLVGAEVARPLLEAILAADRGRTWSAFAPV